MRLVIIIFLLTQGIILWAAKPKNDFESQIQAIQQELSQESSKGLFEEPQKKFSPPKAAVPTLKSASKSSSSILSETVLQAIEREKAEFKPSQEPLLSSQGPFIPKAKAPMDIINLLKKEKKKSNSSLTFQGLSTSLSSKKQLPLAQKVLQSLELEVHAFSAYENYGEPLEPGYQVQDFLIEDSYLSGVLTSESHLRTNFNVVFEAKRNRQIVLPLLKTSSVERLFPQYKGGFLLLSVQELSLNPKDTIHIDAPRMKKRKDPITGDFIESAPFYLDSKFSLVTDKDKFSYLLFTDLSPGNATLTYTVRNQVAQRVVYVTAGEVLYEEPVLEERKVKRFRLHERNTLAQFKELALNISEKKMRLFSAGKNDRKISRSKMNHYEILPLVQLKGERTYIELEHENLKRYLGFREKDNLGISQRSYLNQIYEKHEKHFGRLDSQCVVQLDFKEPIKKLSVQFKSPGGDLDPEVSVVAYDGTVHRADQILNEMKVKSALISGAKYQDGVFYVAAVTQSGARKFLPTYCKAEAPHLIEYM